MLQKYHIRKINQYSFVWKAIIFHFETQLLKFYLYYGKNSIYLSRR